MTNRKAALLEALKAVENQRLEFHGELLTESDASSVYREDCTDAVYSRAIRDAEDAIKALM